MASHPILTSPISQVSPLINRRSPAADVFRLPQFATTQPQVPVPGVTPAPTLTPTQRVRNALPRRTPIGALPPLQRTGGFLNRLQTPVITSVEEPAPSNLPSTFLSAGARRNNLLAFNQPSVRNNDLFQIESRPAIF